MRATGFSLTELLFVVAIIAVMSTMAVPVFSDAQERRVQSAASVVADALRHARSESVRSGVPHGVRQLQGTNQIVVFRVDHDQDPPVEVFDVLHANNSGQSYKVDLQGERATQGTAVSASFNIVGDPDTHEAISFNDRGEPVDGRTGMPLGQPSGRFVVANGRYGLVVEVLRLTGRVEVQPITMAFFPLPLPLPPSPPILPTM